MIKTVIKWSDHEMFVKSLPKIEKKWASGCCSSHICIQIIRRKTLWNFFLDEAYSSTTSLGQYTAMFPTLCLLKLRNPLFSPFIQTAKRCWQWVVASLAVAFREFKYYIVAMVVTLASKVYSGCGHDRKWSLSASQSARPDKLRYHKFTMFW